MSVFTLPVRNDIPDYTFTTTLSGVKYGFRFRFNDLEKFWYFDILTEGGDPILLGVKVVVNFPLIRQYVDARLPPGDFAAIDTSNENLECAFADLGQRVVFVYTDGET